MNVANKVVVVTGSAQGLGKAIATKLAQNGAILFICDVNDKEGEATVASLKEQNFKAHYVHLDVTDEESWVSLYKEVVKLEGKIDVLVNNAGINIRNTIETMTLEELNKMLAVNVGGPFIGIKYAIPLMRENKGGSIINISSICGLIGHKFTTEAYTVTKGALTMMTKTVGVRYAKDNIRCNSIHPSTVETDLVRKLFEDPAKKEERIGEIPLGRIASLDDVANAVLYLASDEATFLNGVALPIDGGLTAY
jgi:NAD(P)-dependent dehydrogenase (short-subunit alcohol dehydrogenase family)